MWHSTTEPHTRVALLTMAQKLYDQARKRARASGLPAAEDAAHGGQKRRAERDRGAVPGACDVGHSGGAPVLAHCQQLSPRGGAARVQRSADAAATGPGPAADPAEERRVAARTIRA